MVGKPVGTIFVELDLDASRYTRGQQKLLQDATATTLNLEKNFQNLGIKSAATMDLMRAKIQNSYEAIANNAKSSANDILRAEEAKNSKLKSLNDQQFGAQTSTIDKLKSNWLAAAASIFTAIKTIGQAFEMAKTGAVLEKQAQAFANLSDAAGTSSRKMLDSLKAASHGVVAEADLMAAAGKAMLMSIPADKISELMKIAAATSRMTGQSITDAFNDITMGVARQSRMILDNLGIIVNADDANAKYAKSLGTTAEALNDAQKRQAFMNAVLAAGGDMIARLGAQSNELTGINKLVAAQADLWNEVNKSVAHLLDKELSGYAKMINWIDEKLKGMRASAGETTMADALKEIEMLRSLESKGMAQPGSTMRKQSEFNRRWSGGSEAEIAAEASMRSWRMPDPMAGWREREGNYAANTEEQNKQIFKDREEWLKKVAEEAKKAEEAIKQLHEQVKKLEDEFAASKIFSGESSNYARMEEQLRSGSQVDTMMARKTMELQKQAEAIYKLDEVANKERWYQAYVDGIDEATRANEIFKDSMDVMSQSFSNAFAGFVAGTTSAKDAFQGMVQSVIAGMMRIATQSASEQLMGMLFKAGSGLASSYFGGSTPSGMGSGAGVPWGGQTGDWGAVMHAGGVVGVPGPMRPMPAWMIATAPRLHGGLAPDEFPAVLQRGERVTPKGGSTGGPNITINVAAPGGRMDRESLSSLQAGLFSTLQRAGSRNN